MKKEFVKCSDCKYRTDKPEGFCRLTNGFILKKGEGFCSEGAPFNSKYRIMENETIFFGGKTLFRIQACKDFGDVLKGEVGGYIEKEANLSQEGNCWIGGKAKVFENARVSGNARIRGEAQVYGDAVVDGNASVNTEAQVYGTARVTDNAWVGGFAIVKENSLVKTNALILENAFITDNATIAGEARIKGEAIVGGDSFVGLKAEVSGRSQILGHAAVHNAHIKDSVQITDNAYIDFDGELVGETRLGKNAYIKSYQDLLVIHTYTEGLVLTSYQVITFYKTTDESIVYTCNGDVVAPLESLSSNFTVSNRVELQKYVEAYFNLGSETKTLQQKALRELEERKEALKKTYEEEAEEELGKEWEKKSYF